MNKYRSLQTRLNCTLRLLICSMVLMIPLASPAIFSSNESISSSSSSFIHYSGSMVKVGDRNLSIAAWEGLMNTINCLTSIHGMWVNTTTTTAPINHVLDNNDDDVEVNGHRYRRGITHVPLYESVYSNDDALVTKVYTACGNRHRRIGLDYYWLPPPSCRQQHQLVKFNVESLCYLLRGRILIFIGDSLSLHHYETTVNAIGNRTTYGHSPSYDHYWEHYDYCVRNHWGDENFQVTYIKWNSIMEDKMELVKRMHHSSINGSVIIANWGAFYVSDSRVKQRRREIIRKFNEQLPTSLFIYRSSNMAHLNCDNYKVPDNVDHNPAPHPYKINWHWQDFPLQNVLWEDYLYQYHPGKIYLNVFDLIRKRPDQHPGDQHSQDCLHYCIPGPVDTYVILIHTVLFYVEYYSSISSSSSINSSSSITSSTSQFL